MMTATRPSNLPSYVNGSTRAVLCAKIAASLPASCRKARIHVPHRAEKDSIGKSVNDLG